ncbi:MAG: RagB/SusD family nutrient uptake outer membrane protein, partial [Bacteroidota bacterium]
LPEEYDPSQHPEDYQDRAKRDAARFLLAKTYFLMGNEFWNAGQDGDGGALEQINTIIDSERYPLVQSDSLQQVFLAKGLNQKASETVWYATYYFRNAWRAPRLERMYSDFTGRRDRGIAMSKTTLEQIGWNDSTVAQQDERYNDWFRRYEAGEDPAFSAEEYEDSYNVWCAKFTDRTANFVVFRSPELYLMRAAMRLAGGDASAAAEDLNVTRTRAGLAPLATATEAEVSAEWIKELGFEGRRLFYLQATQQQVPPGDRTGTQMIPYNDPSLVRDLPRVELVRNPAIAGE